MAFPNWGDVPSWLAAGSLLLAFRVFLRDRAAAERAQVEKVAIWGRIKRGAHFDPEPGSDEIEVQMCVKNTSDLVVEVHQIAWTLQTRWFVRIEDDPVPVRQGMPGKADVMRFLGAVGVPPQDSWESQWIKVNLIHTTPGEKAALDPFSEGVKCVISYALMTDNAGRRWIAQQHKGKLTKRFRWYTKPGSYYPLSGKILL